MIDDSLIFSDLVPFSLAGWPKCKDGTIILEGDSKRLIRSERMYKDEEQTKGARTSLMGNETSESIGQDTKVEDVIELESFEICRLVCYL